MRVSEFVAGLERLIPPTLALPDDPVGLQVMPSDAELATVAVAYEIDDRVVELAAEAGAGLIVAFHPLIYRPLTRLSPGGRVERCVIELVRRGISLYVTHTAFDCHPRGTSRLLAEALALEEIVPMIASAGIDGAGFGAIGTLRQPLSLAELGERVQHVCATAAVRVSYGGSRRLETQVRRIAVVGGSGMSYYDRAVDAGADAFITADIGYHGFHAANDRIPVLDPGHAESEALVTTGMTALLQQMVDDRQMPLSIVPLTESTNPVHYIVIQ